ncbi:fatty acyl-CoA reductase wat-like [Sitophilus oryzae]|uniref:Fatty acyl-CoA reductase n=1 Tax=Sitophilus oryzae TaxID=7048 RepID=A0A6J2Y8T3_SITOR|nr:fatty acyl-CoA reductase wat-like [Sitophilus oryzae]
MVADRYGYATFENQNNYKNLEEYPFIKNVTDIHEIHSFEEDLNLTPIQKFYDGANVFITGSTGFLGKILVEKLLRSCPTLSTMYLLVRSKKGKSMEERIDEMFDDVIFQKMKEECPKYRHKVVGVGGDCTLSGIGLSIQDRRLLVDEVNIVFHVAATVRFDEKIKTAVAINIRAPRDLLRLSREMPNLKCFMHTSTIFGNCMQSVIEEKVYPPAIDSHKLILMTECAPEKILEEITPKLIEPYPNTYTFTKQVAEDLVKKEGENLPVAIFRPAIVVSTYKEPFPAWINNMYGPTGVCAGSGVGLIRALHCDAKCNANLVPVDMCVNSLIAAAWETALSHKQAIKDGQQYEIPVYNYESFSSQPITWGKYMQLTENYGLIYPSIKAIWYYSLTLYKYYPIYLFVTFFLHTIPALFADVGLFCIGRKPRMVAAYKKIHKYSKVISYFAVREWKIKSNRVENLVNSMSDRDQEIFFSDLKKLNWQEYFVYYVRGIRVFLIQDPLDTLAAAKRNWKRFYYVHQFVKILFLFVIFQFLCSLALKFLSLL